MKRVGCAFTGHRPHKFPWKYDETDHRCIALKMVLCKEIMKLIESGVTDFYSGMAEGTDCWAAISVLNQRKKNPQLKLHCILPCKEQKNRWSLSAQKVYDSILEKADSVVCINQEYDRNCMMERNRRLVDSADIILAVYNGEWRSGTAATVRYAQKKKKEIVIIDPTTLRVTSCRL